MEVYKFGEGFGEFRRVDGDSSKRERDNNGGRTVKRPRNSDSAGSVNTSVHELLSAFVTSVSAEGEPLSSTPHQSTRHYSFRLTQHCPAQDYARTASQEITKSNLMMLDAQKLSDAKYRHLLHLCCRCFDVSKMEVNISMIQKKKYVKRDLSHTVIDQWRILSDKISGYSKERLNRLLDYAVTEVVTPDRFDLMCSEIKPILCSKKIRDGLLTLIEEKKVNHKKLVTYKWNEVQREFHSLYNDDERKLFFVKFFIKKMQIIGSDSFKVRLCKDFNISFNELKGIPSQCQ